MSFLKIKTPFNQQTIPQTWHINYCNKRAINISQFFRVATCQNQIEILFRKKNSEKKFKKKGQIFLSLKNRVFVSF